MKIQIGKAKDIMRFYNVYRTCKDTYDDLKKIKLERVNVSGNNQFYKFSNWSEYRGALLVLRNVPMFKDEVDKIFNQIPVYEREKDIPELSIQTGNAVNSTNATLTQRIKAIIDLYESMGLKDHEIGIDVKIPDTDSFKDYIKCLNDIEFVLYQCPYLRDKDEIIKFASVDVGSNWISFLVTGVIAMAGISSIVSNFAVILNVAIDLRKKWKDLKYYESQIDKKEDVLNQNLEVFEILKKNEMELAIDSLQNKIGDVADPEEKARVEKSLDRLASLLDRGVEFYASIDAPKEVQELFPKMVDKPLLTDLMKFIEDKKQK